MRLSQLEGLYQEIILDHYRHPHHYGSLDHRDYQIEMINPSCGDMLMLEAKVDANEKLIQLGFHGSGCAISIASASVMTDLLEGKTLQEAKHLSHSFSKMITEPQIDIEALKDELKEAVILSGVRQFPARVKCATIAWQAVQKINLQNKDK